MNRGTSPVVGTTILVGLTVLLAVGVGATALDAVPSPSSARPVAVSATVAADTGHIAFVYRGGPPLDVRDLAILISIDGVALAHQPPVPFFSAAGFRPGPTGPFNSASDPVWRAGERASLRLAGTNVPTLSPGSTVTIRLATDERVLARIEVTAR